MNEEEVTKELGKMWGDELTNYVLVKKPSSILGYVIMNTTYNSMIIIEQEPVARFVIDRMLEHGVRVVDDFETVKNPDRPDPIFYSPGHEAQYRKWQK